MRDQLAFRDCLLALGRRYQRLHQFRQALRYFHQLAACAELPADLAEEVHVRLAQVYLRLRRYRRARRHLSIALLYQPACVRYHYLMVKALSKGRFGDPVRAVAHCQQALRQAPDQPRLLAAFGRLCLHLDRTEEGLEALARSVQLAPNDPVIVGRLARGLCQANRLAEAREVLLAARFRNPRDARFQRLWNRFLFQQLRERQQADRRAARWWPQEETPLLLPFPQSTAGPNPSDGVVRQDAAEALPAPHWQRPARRSDWKHG